MKLSLVRRQLARGLLFFHFVGLSMCVGTIFVNVVIERRTRDTDLHLLSAGRDLISLSIGSIVQTGFWMTVMTGFLIVPFRYGFRIPIWIWIKLAITNAIFSIAVMALTPANDAATQWAHWSDDHGQLAPQFQENVAQADFYGMLILSLFLIATAVGIWKPFSRIIRGRRPKGDATEAS